MTVNGERAGIAAILNPGRMLADGVPYPDFHDATERIEDLEGWFDFWAAKGQAYEARGETALASGSRVSAGEWLWLAALSWHYAQFMWFHDPARRELGQRRKVELYDRAAPHLDPPAARLDVPFDGISIPGFLRLPPGTAPGAGWPCAVVIGGLESTKEESRLFEEMCLRRGLATYSFDGPGQGELFFDRKIQPDFERYTSAVLDALEGRPELDSSRLGVIGRSLGGFYAIRSAAYDERLKACVAWGFFYDMSDFDSMPAHTQAGFVYVAGGSRDGLEQALRLEDAAARLRTPTLLLNGRDDPIFPLRQMQLTLDALAAAPTEVAIEKQGDHCCHNMGQIVRPRMADWLAARLCA